jgi:hypothetical protein
MKIPGIGDRAAQVVISEIGVDMARFPSAAHLASWAGLCPGNHESAGKHRSGRTRKGSTELRAIRCESAWSAGRTSTYVGAQFPPLFTRRIDNPEPPTIPTWVPGHRPLCPECARSP